ncbi:MAG: Hpt domain-containing protein [Bdellovibrionales bacterium]
MIEIDIPLFDFRRLHMIAETEQEKISFLEVFFDMAETILTEMESALRNNASLQWTEAAHKLRGAAANIGMSTLERICLESEKEGGQKPDSRIIYLKQTKDELIQIKNYIAEKHPPLIAT